jgi:hypothetical protein
MSRSSKVETAAAALYRTANLNLASYLVASGRLTLDHVEAHVRHSEFFFRDPEGLGPAIAAEFATKDLKVSAKLLLDSRAALLNEMRREVGDGKKS